MRRWACAAALALLLAPAAGAAAAPASPTVDQSPTKTVKEPFPPSPDAARLTSQRVLTLFLAYPKVAAWLEHYPRKPQTAATFDKASRTWKAPVPSSTFPSAISPARPDQTCAFHVRDALSNVAAVWGLRG